jgi:serine/threonine-protein kinase
VIAFGVTIGGQTMLAVRRLDEDKIRIIGESAGAIGSAAFSADGKWLAFNTDGRIYKTPVRGGPSTPIGLSNWAQMTWIGNDAIVYTTNYDSGLSRMSSEGRDTATLTTPDRKKVELGHWWPQVLPDGDHIIFTNYTTPAEKSKIEVLSLSSGKRQVVLEGGYFGRYYDGHLLFVKNNVVFSTKFDPGSFRVSGTAVPLPLDIDTNPPSGWASFAVAGNGTMAYRERSLKEIELTWTDEAGKEEPALDSAGNYTSIAPSPDGRKIAVVRNGDVWIYDRQRRFFTRLTQTDQIEGNLAWSSDSKEVLYVRDVPQYDVFRRVADQSRPEELVVTSSNDKDGMAVSPDGKFLLYEEDSGGNDIYLVPYDEPHSTPQRLIGGPKSQREAQFSPDGKWLTYASLESGRAEVYVSPFPVDRGPARQQLSENGGEEPHWGPGGRSIYFASGAGIMRATVNPGTGEIGKPVLLDHIQPAVIWTIGADGRLLVGRPKKGSESRMVKLLFNWTSILDEAGKQ